MWEIICSRKSTLLNISAKTEYACVAMLELAKNMRQPEPVRIKEIAEKHGIPSRFLVQILLQLKGAGMVASTRGASGGYRLAMKPEDINLYQVMNLIDGVQAIKTNVKVESPASKLLNQIWNHLTEDNVKRLQKLTFADLLEKCESQPENMYYI